MLADAMNDAPNDPLHLTHCPQCAYALHGHAAPGRCPECGWAFDRDTIAIPIIRVIAGSTIATRATDVVAGLWIILFFVIGPVDVIPVFSMIARTFWWLGWLGVAWLVGRGGWIILRRLLDARSPRRRELIATRTALLEMSPRGQVARFTWRLFDFVELRPSSRAGAPRLRFGDALGISMTAVVHGDVRLAERARERLTERIHAARERQANRAEWDDEADAG